MAKPETRRDPDIDHTSGLPILVARRVDGFGERLRAMLNAMAAARLLPGTFRFSWPPAGYWMVAGGDWHSVRPVEQTFAPEFVAAWHMAPEEAARLDPAPLATVSDHAAAAYVVEQGWLDDQAPGVFPDWQEALPHCFADIAFAPDLEEARAAAATIPGDFGETTAIHLRAGDIVYGRARRLGRLYVGKACPWPLADAICRDLAARGHGILLFGQDEPLVDWLRDRHGARSAADISRHYGFDRAQQALFEICLMSRCARIVSGSSGFALLASAIGKRPSQYVYRYFKGAQTRRIVVDAALAPPPDDRISPLQHAFACNVAIKLRGDAHLADARGMALLDQAVAADPENAFFGILQGVARVRAGDAAALETSLRPRLAQGPEAVNNVLAVAGSANHNAVPGLASVLADLETAARFGGALAAWCASWAHAARNDPSRAAEFAALCQSATPPLGLDLPFPPGTPRSPAPGERAFHGLPLQGDAPTAAHLARFVQQLAVRPSPVPLTAIGTDPARTCLLPEDLDGIAACFTAGAQGGPHVEDHLSLRHGIPSHICALLPHPSPPGPHTVETLRLDTTDAEGSVSLDGWVARHRPDPGDLILRLNIDGAEWRTLLAASDATLARVRILVLHLHGLDQVDRPGVLEAAILPVLDRLSAQFACVHVRPDNARLAVSVPGLDEPLPSRLEATFLRHDRFDGRTLHPVELPHPLDFRFDDPSRPPLPAGDLFRGRPPTPAEQARMTEARIDWNQRQQIARLEQRVARLEADRARIRTDRDALLQEATAREAELRAFKKKAARLAARARQAETRIATLRRSTSWRLTSPLRWLARSLRFPPGRPPR